MKTKTAMSQINSFLLALGLVSVFGVGCSGSQQEDTEILEATDEGKEEAKSEASEPVEEAAAKPAEAPVVEVAPTTAPAKTNPIVDKNRVVRYVSTDEGVIRSQPNDTAEQVGKLEKGDMILAVEENGWCKISDTMYIKADSVTSKAVARKRGPAAWTKPAH